MPPRFLIDTNLYIRAFRNAEDAAELRRFYAAYTPACHLSAVVLHELLVGANGTEQARAIQDRVAKPFRRTARIVTPSASAWRVAAETIAQLAWEEGLDRRTLPRSFLNDALLAASCREEGITIVTENARDFLRLQRLVDFEFIPPWPG
jgi:predicted nucleic acid-binding protein